jgi:hypothetical protein
MQSEIVKMDLVLEIRAVSNAYLDTFFLKLDGF